MTRRLRIAGTAFGAFLVPACAGLQTEPTVVRPLDPPTAVGQRGTPPPTPTGKVTRTAEKFADGRAEATSTFVPKPVAVADAAPVPVPLPQPLPAPAMPGVAVSPPAAGISPVEHKRADAAPPAPTMPRVVPPADAVKAPADTVKAPADTVKAPADAVKAPADAVKAPAADPDSVVQPHWPVIKGSLPLVESPAPVVPLVPPSELIPMAVPDEGPGIVPPPPAGTPPALPPGVIGTSLHQSNASPMIAPAAVEPTLPTEPVVTPVAAPILAESPTPVAGESPLLKAVRAFQQNKPDEAVELLKGYDPATQQVLLSLMPALVRLSEGKLQSMKPEEMDVLLEQLTRVPNMLRARASLQANNVRLCREVHNFAHVEPFTDRHTFCPGDIVYLYMELANFSCTPDPKGGYSVSLDSNLELRDSTGTVVWRADPKEVPDKVSTPPQDYYRNFRLCIPAVPTGTYKLSVKMTDRPTGREVVKVVELRVGAK